jgi:hypothetical protein
MTNISKRLEAVISREFKKTILPVKTEQGILVGDVLIVSRDTVKDIYKKGNLKYKDVFLNRAAIAIANFLALNKNISTADSIYRIDQEYSKWFTDSQYLRHQYQKCQDTDRADILWARYEESRTKAYEAKNRVEALLTIE